MALDSLTQITSSGISSTSTITVTAIAGRITGDVSSSGVSTFTTLKVGTGVTISGGIVTATTFSGALSGNATGLSGTPNITVGSITAASATFSGNVSVAGTVTYEDTTNVDSIGVVTARSGVRVSAGSSVGIGTNNPAEQLELSAGSERLMIGANSPSTYSRIAARNTANSGYRGLQIDGSDLLINSNTSGNILACTGGGNLGIGTASPGARLDVNGSSKFNGSLTIQSSGTTRGYFGDVDGTTNMQLRAENAIEFKAGGNTERMRISSSGNVGIGVTNPGTVLHIRGESGTTSTSDSPLYVDVPHNKISMFIGRQTSTSGFSDQTYSGNIRFNGSDVAWGDISYYPNGNSSTGSFRFTRNGSTVSSTRRQRLCRPAVSRLR